MDAEVISIGDELTSGERLDTNSQWLSQRLAGLGIRTLFHTTVADDLTSNQAVFANACRRADVVISTGGLGPTADDLTRQSLAQLLDVDLVQDDASLRHIEERFSRRDRPMPESNRIQAMFPAGTRPIPNPHGTAPGIHGQRDRANFFCLPGVPAEMREMWNETVEASLVEMLGAQRRVIRNRRLKCFGVGESDLERMLPDLIRRGREPTVGITVSQATITLRITAHGADDEECQCLIAPTEATIRECLGNLVFGEEDDELHHVVHRELRRRNHTMAIVECGTHGLLASWFAPLRDSDQLGATSFNTLPFAAVLQDERCLASLGLAVDEPLTSEAAVGALARAVKQLTLADIVAVVGDFTHPIGDLDGVCPCAIWGPTDETEPLDKAGPQVVTFASRLAGHPEVVRPRIAKQVLDRIRISLNIADHGAAQ
jgi:nicotinamide-nucleotide amidase